MLWDLIDLDFWFLVFDFFFERDEKCVCHWTGWLAGWLAVFVAWPNLAWPAGHLIEFHNLARSVAR